MSVYKKSIAELERLVDQNMDALQSQYERLGDQLANAMPEGASDETYGERISRISALRDEITEKERTIQAWDELTDELDSIDEAISQIDAGIEEKVSAIEPSYEAIGQAALEAYLSDPVTNQALATAVGTVVTLDETIREKSEEIDSLEGPKAPDGFIGKTFAKGRGLVLKGSLRTKEMQRSRAIREAGERVCAGDVGGFAAASPVAKALEPVRPMLNEIEKLKEERKQLETDRVEVENKRLEIEKTERMRNPARNLGHEVERLRADSAEIARELGRAYAKEVSKPDDAVKKIFESIDRLKGQNAEVESLIERLRAAVDVERMEAEIASQQKSRVKHEQEIESIDQEIERLETDKATRAKDRGSSASLEQNVSELIGPAEAESE